MGARFYFTLLAIVVAIGVGGAVLFWVIGSAFLAWGLLGGFLAIAMAALGIGWLVDRRRPR